MSGAFGVRDFVPRLGIFFKNSLAIVQKNNVVIFYSLFLVGKG